MLHKVTNRLLKRLILVLIAAGLTIPVIFVSLKKLEVLGASQVEHVFKPTSVTLTINTIFSDQLHAAIKEFVHARCGQRTVFSFDSQAFYNELKDHFPIVRDMDFSFGADKVLKLTINGTTPFCRVNQTLVLGDQPTLFDLKLFAAADPAQLPNITIDEQWYDDKLDAHVYDFVRAIPTDYWRQYVITYHSPHHIVLQPHQSICRSAIVVDEKTFFEERKFAMLSPLFGRLCQRGDITKKMLQSKHTPLVFDFRLKNQIIVKFVQAGKRGKGK